MKIPELIDELIKLSCEEMPQEAKECLERLELDSAPLQPLTQYSMI